MQIQIPTGVRRTYRLDTYRDGGTVVLRDNAGQIHCLLNNQIGTNHRGKLFKDRDNNIFVPVSKDELPTFTQSINEILSSLDTTNEYTHAKKEAIIGQLKAINADYAGYYTANS